MRQLLLKSVQEAVRAVALLQEESTLDFIEKAAERVARCYEKKGKLLIAGNGGSLCDAMHFAEELTGQFRAKRAALPAIALSDPGHLTCVGNDFGFNAIFSRGVEAHGRPGDVFIALTTSGNSPNLIEAVMMAKKKGMETIGFLGKTGGTLRGVCDLELIVSGFPFSDRIQEVHMTIIHILIELVEQRLFCAPSPYTSSRAPLSVG